MSRDPGLFLVAAGGFLAFVGLLIVPLDSATAVAAAALGGAVAVVGGIIAVTDRP